MMDLSRFDLKGGRGPSTGLACELCAGVAAAEVLKIVLKHGSVRAAPWYHHFDAYRSRWKRGWLPLGNRNPLQQLKLAVARRVAARLSRNAQPPMRDPATMTDMEYIVDQASWAPSGDNTQPWRFEVLDEDRVIVHLTSKGDIYDYSDGEPTLIAGGFLLETMRIAASCRKRELRWQYLGARDRTHRFDVVLRRANLPVDPLLSFIPIRSVNRGAYRLQPLAPSQKAALELALGPEFTIEWLEAFPKRWRIAYINAVATNIRLSIPETYAVHRRILDFERDFSPNGLPIRAIGLDPIAQRLTRYLMKSWRRVDLMNRFGGGTLLARLEMDLIPGLFCAAHFAIRAKFGNPGAAVERACRLGEAAQRFWLTATQLGLSVQPTLATICFARRSSEVAPFTQHKSARAQAKWLLSQPELGDIHDCIQFRGRIGIPRSLKVTSRSVRMQPDELTDIDRIAAREIEIIC
jgi:nitroreductase